MMDALVFAGGGTGGHLFPGLAMAGEFLERTPGMKVYFVGSGRGLEAKVLQEKGYGYFKIASAGLTDKKGLGKVGAAFRTMRGVVQSLFFLLRLNPALVVGLGGYSSGPVGLAARILGIPLALQEQNVRPGLTNRLLGRFARLILCSWEETTGFFRSDRVRVVGNPVRPEFLKCGRVVGEGDLHILITGGSQGAHQLNLVAPDAVAALHRIRGAVRVTHQTGEKDEASVSERYEELGVDCRVSAFIPDMAEAMCDADLVISRAGATSLAELAVLGRGAVLVPYPYASHGHQEQNARVWEEKGAGRVILESELTAERLASTLEELLSDVEGIRRMADIARSMGRPDAAKEAVAACLEILGNDETN
jgi:UDP-N-acetylglucosamine--N-acetylmuramyl-(pentapeptide) pyrophosphoryl-undecaprenol N-acetylglucosamine transferase